MFIGAGLSGSGAEILVRAGSYVMAVGGTWRAVRDLLFVHPAVSEMFPTMIQTRRLLTTGIEIETRQGAAGTVRKSFSR